MRKCNYAKLSGLVLVLVYLYEYKISDDYDVLKEFHNLLQSYCPHYQNIDEYEIYVCTYFNYDASTHKSMIYLLQIFGAYPGDIFKSKRFQNKHTVERINTIFQKYDIKHIKHIDESSNIFKTFKLNQIMPIWKKNFNE